MTWDFRRHSPRAGDGAAEAESVTGKICREIDVARKKFGHVFSPVAMKQDTSPGLEAVPVSCYSGSFKTWAFDNDFMAELDDA